jgi:ATP-dependent protease ClpP protease subunit
MKNALARVRAARLKALKDTGDVSPVALYWDDPELLTDGSGDTFQLWFNDMIDDWFGISAAMIVEALLVADGRDVLVHLNSPGGLVTEGLSIHSTFKQYAGKVTMRVEGLAASAASFVMLAADEVIIEPNAMVMIHDAWDITMGPASEHRKTADFLDKVSDNIASMYAAKSGTDAADWRAAMLEETWYIGAEAVDAGLADSVTSDGTELETAAASRWSSIYAGGRRGAAAKATGGKIGCWPPVDLAPEPVTPKLRVIDGDAPKAQTKEPETPAWWAKLQSGLKGVQQ